MTIKARWADKECEFKVLGITDGHSPENATHFLNQEGDIRKCSGKGILIRETMWLQLVGKRHAFGGVVYEETGEVRKVQGNEYHLVDGELYHRAGRATETFAKFPILRPIPLTEGS